MYSYDSDDYSSYYSYNDDDYDSYYSTSTYTSTEPTLSTSEQSTLIKEILAMGVVAWVIVIAVAVLLIVSQWKVFTKAKKHGYAALIPIHSTMVTYEVARVPGWYFFLSLIPFVNIYIAFKTNICLARQFGKSTGFGVLMVFFPVICMPILAFSKAKYVEGEAPGLREDPID